MNDLFVIKYRKQSADFMIFPSSYQILHQTQHSIICLSLIGKCDFWEVILLLQTEEVFKQQSTSLSILLSNISFPLKPVDSHHLSFASSVSKLNYNMPRRKIPGPRSLCREFQWRKRQRSPDKPLYLFRVVTGQMWAVIFAAGYGSLV